MELIGQGKEGELFRYLLGLGHEDVGSKGLQLGLESTFEDEYYEKAVRRLLGQTTLFWIQRHRLDSVNCYLVRNPIRDSAKDVVGQQLAHTPNGENGRKHQQYEKGL